MGPAGSSHHPSLFSLAFKGLRSLIKRSDVSLCGTANKPPFISFLPSFKAWDLGRKVTIWAACNFLSNPSQSSSFTLWQAGGSSPLQQLVGMSRGIRRYSSRCLPLRCSFGSKTPAFSGSEMRLGSTSKAPVKAVSRSMLGSYWLLWILSTNFWSWLVPHSMVPLGQAQ